VQLEAFRLKVGLVQKYYAGVGNALKATIDRRSGRKVKCLCRA